jgi:hypothetical protein
MKQPFSLHDGPVDFVPSRSVVFITDSNFCKTILLLLQLKWLLVCASRNVWNSSISLPSSTMAGMPSSGQYTCPFLMALASAWACANAFCEEGTPLALYNWWAAAAAAAAVVVVLQSSYSSSTVS